ncbi:MAG TPA: translation elongation factor Ts [Thermoflexia bacterium]|nr:translation elongation factor Ts [Thermoflexia bacterium]
MQITAQMVKELRGATSAGILDCRKALVATDGDFDRAVDHLREKGLAQAAKRMSREAHDGLVVSYIHAGGRIGALVEVNCETDFVARTTEYRSLVDEIAMQVAAMAPRYIKRDDVPPAVVEHEREVYRARTLEEGKPERIVDHIVDGRMEKFYSEVCLLEQEYIRDSGKTIAELIKETIATMGENIVVRRFVRFALGEGEE